MLDEAKRGSVVKIEQLELHRGVKITISGEGWYGGLIELIFNETDTRAWKIGDRVDIKVVRDENQ